MRALICSEYGDGANTTIGELPTPKPEASYVQIKVHSTGIGYVDALMVRNKHQNKHELPFAAGMAVAGTISALGAGVADIALGTRVMALAYDGGLAEYALAPQGEVFPIPATMEFTSAASIASGYLTPHAALRWDAQIQPGETMLVLGASGTVGSAAVEVGKAMGARVIAAASTEAKLDIARAKGADETICYGTTDLYAAVQELSNKKGVDVVYDPVGGDLYEAAFKGLGWGGRYVVIGFAGGAIPQFAANRLLVKNRKALGFVLMYYRRFRQDLLQRSAQELSELFLQGKLRAQPSAVISLAQAGPAIDDFYCRRAVGNTVVDLIER
jgi:NADPH:quinone reductase